MFSGHGLNLLDVHILTTYRQYYHWEYANIESATKTLYLSDL